MAHPFHFPVSLPRWTSDEFDKKRQEYTAEHGYTIVIPGFEDIFHYKINPEPTPLELIHYKAKNIDKLGEVRYQEIKDLMLKKKERFLNMLASPTPRGAMNAASALTFLDDINDTLGTIGVVARTAAHLLPGTAAKMLSGPAGWLFLAADITNIAMELSRLPWKAKRLQHDLHHAVGLNPLSKKAKLSRLNKLKRLKLSKGEIIEGLQTTDNMFGVGVSLGPIMGLLYDIPFGFYRAFQGRKVTVKGLPSPFYWADRAVNRMFRGAAQLWYGEPQFTDKELGQSMVAFNYATQWQKAYAQDKSPLDFIDDPSGIELPIHGPVYPSTVDVIESEVGLMDNYLGWPATGTQWMSSNEMIDNHTDRVIENIKGWEERNKHDMEGSVSIQNAVESGMNSVAILEGDDALIWQHEVVAGAYLKLLNIGYRLPLDTTDEQLNCFTNNLLAYADAELEPSMKEIGKAAMYPCGINFTTVVPERPPLDPEAEAERARKAIDRLKIWYLGTSIGISHTLCGPPWQLPTRKREILIATLRRKLSWLRRYGYPANEPGTSLALIPDPERRSCVSGYLHM